MPVPKEYHGHIIGQKGHDVRRLMEDYDVNIMVPPSAEATDVLRITGSPANVELTKHAIGERVKQLDEEKVERVGLKTSFVNLHYILYLYTSFL